ncbi:hypothetical protein AVEN_152901-1 [Araneus ventricosus]|uniref:Uncharacterized protein n=1 Tax=Araneus ventricosus TaxID=182803 RepID=A0A4Y2AEM9_ARAVE|nr:hypothetical protein AVEN_152901-1 [Araneus ventricosus]
MLEKVFVTLTGSSDTGVTSTLHGISRILEDFGHISDLPCTYRYARDMVFILINWCLIHHGFHMTTHMTDLMINQGNQPNRYDLCNTAKSLRSSRSFTIYYSSLKQTTVPQPLVQSCKCCMVRSTPLRNTFLVLAHTASPVNFMNPYAK